METWEYGALDIHNPDSTTLRRYFELLSSRIANVQGDIFEFGVSSGRSIVTTALLMAEQEIQRTVYGFDTFGGFPSYHAYDEPGHFRLLRESGKITEGHWRKILRNQTLVSARLGHGELRTGNLSNSADFSKTSMELVKRKAEVLGLGEKIRLIQGDFTKSESGMIPKIPLAAVLLDCDLYEGYAVVLDQIWDQLSLGGFVYLDEYYSLKFPGPRIAVLDFLNSHPEAKLTRLPDWLDFERWILEK